jgi:hypothetical protein
MRATSTSTHQSTLAQDILPSIDAIAAYIYGEATPSTVRRIRHLIAGHNLPITKKGGRIESRKSWLDKLYAEPDQRAAGAPK